MDMGKIIGDSFKYPVSNWSRLLIFGIIVLSSQLSFEVITGYGNINNLLYLLVIPGIIASFMMNGYQLRTIAASIFGEMNLLNLMNGLECS